MADKSKRERIPQPEVLAWLQTNYPALHQGAEIDRHWVWLTANLKGEQHSATRTALKAFGFIFAKKRGGHPLPSGKLGTWGHSCLKPLPFKRRFKGRPSPNNQQPQPVTDRIDPVEVTQPEVSSVEAEALAFLPHRIRPMRPIRPLSPSQSSDPPVKNSLLMSEFFPSKVPAVTLAFSAAEPKPTTCAS